MSESNNSKPFGNVTESPFKDSNGNWLTSSLFYEFRDPFTQIEPRWTIRNEEFRGYPSAKQVYLDCMDVTEYDPAHMITECWDHWVRILENKRILAEVEKWRTELELILRRDAIKKLQLSDKGSDHKWLADRGWKTNPVGRPTKQSKQADANLQAAINEDLQRVQQVGKLN